MDLYIAARWKASDVLASPQSDHLKLCSLKWARPDAGYPDCTEHTRRRAQPHIIVLALSLALLWVHSVCCFLVSEVWEPPSPVTPTVHPAPTHRHCNLFGRVHGWQIHCRLCLLWRFVCSYFCWGWRKDLIYCNASDQWRLQPFDI